MPKWEIEPGEYFSRLHLTEREFENRLHLPDVKRVQKIIPLCDMASIEAVIPMTNEMLISLVRKIKTQNGLEPFKEATCRVVRMDPDSPSFFIGQKFLYREKYVAILEHAPRILASFATGSSGLSELAPHFIFGLDTEGTYAMACYLPPLIENHNGHFVVMDGIHRNFIVRQVGGMVLALCIYNVNVPFPCDFKTWNDLLVVPVAEKPKELSERYFGLKQELFRDLKHLGIDG